MNAHFVKFVSLSIALCLLITGCATSRNVITDPFNEYRTDAFFFRAVGVGQDTDMQRARSKAIHNAKIEIARNANSVCQQVILDYLHQTENGDNIQLKEQFISVSTETVSESLVHVMIEDIVYNKDKNNKYTCYAKVKVSEENVFSTFANRSQEKMDINTELVKQIADKVVNQITAK